MNTSKKIISLLMCMLMVLTIVPMSVFAAEATEIDTVHIEGLPVPLYGQTVTEYRQIVSGNRKDGTLKINGNAFTSADWHYGNLESDGSAFLDENKNNLDIYGNSTELITAGTYYYCDWFIPTDGYAFADDVTVPVPAGATSVEIERDGEMLGVYVKFEVEATEIGTINIEGIPAPVYGQTVGEYNDVMRAGSMNGTHKINGSTRVNIAENIFYGNIELSDWEYYNSEKSYIAPSSADNLPSVYYLVHWLNPAAGYKFSDDVAVTVDGAVSVETELDEEGCLAVWAKYEVKATEIDTVNLTYDLDYIDLNTFYNENSVTVRARLALATDTAGIKISYGNCCVSYIDSHGDYYNCTYPSKEIIAEKDYYIRAVLMLEDGYDWPTAAKSDEPSGLKIISNGTDISDTVYIKYRSDLNWIIVYAKIGKPSTEPVIGGVSISDSAIMLDKGESHSFIVDVYGNADDKTVTWTVEGAVSANTTVDSMGKLTIGADETADEITVKATSNYNSKKFVVAKVKIGAPTEIDTVHIEGVPAPVYGQTIKSYYESVEAKITDGTITVNDEVYDSTAYKYGNLFDDGWNVRSEADGYLSSTSTDLIKEGTYYVAMWFYPDIGYVIPEVVNVLFDGAKSVKIEVESDGCLDIRAEYEVKCPHTYDNDCDAECNLCTEIRTAPHTYDNACDAECNICKAPRTPANHTGGTATCTEKGKCSVCGEAYGSVNKDNHKSLTTLKAEAATCTKTGLTEGKKCSVCGVTIVAQKPVAKKAHTLTTLKAVAATYKADGKTEGKKCTVCGTVTVAQKTVAKKVLGKVTGLKTKAVKLSSGTKTTLTLAWTKVADAEKYEVYQKSGGKWKKVGTTAKTALTVKKLKANKSYKFKVRAIRTDAQGAYSSVFTGKTVPLKTTLTLKAGKKALTASWKTVANITGYEVTYSTSKKFSKKTTKTVTIKKVKTKKTTIKKLKKGKKYYVKVRAYKTVGSKKIYSAWSSVKNVKVK